MIKKKEMERLNLMMNLKKILKEILKMIKKINLELQNLKMEKHWLEIMKMIFY